MSNLQSQVEFDPVTSIEAREQIERLDATISDIMAKLADYTSHLRAEAANVDRSWAHRARDKIAWLHKDIARLKRRERELTVEEDAVRKQQEADERREEKARVLAEKIRLKAEEEHALKMERLRLHNAGAAERLKIKVELQNNWDRVLIGVLKQEFDADEWRDIVREAVELAERDGIEIPSGVRRRMQARTTEAA